MEGMSPEKKTMGRPKKKLDSEQRARREIANSNERRRMKCINNGFHCLRKILKKNNNSEKQSKAALLHECANYIQKLELDINLFTEQNRMLKNFIDSQQKRESNIETDDQNVQRNEIKTIETFFKDNTLKQTEKAIKTGTNVLPDSQLKNFKQINDFNSMRRIAFEEPEEFRQKVNSEVTELKSLLEREQKIRSGTEDKQRSIELKSKDDKSVCLQNSIDSTIFVNQRQTNQLFSFLSPPIQISSNFYENNVQDKPLNLIKDKSKSKSSFNSYGFENSLARQTRNLSNNYDIYSGPHSYLTDNLKLRKEFNTNITPNNVQIKPIYLNGYQNREQKGFSQKFQLKETQRNHIENMVFPGESSSSNISNIKVNENLDLILKAIQHIEGTAELMTTSKQSSYIKQFAQNLKSSSVSTNQYFSNLLSDVYNPKSFTKLKPTVHSVDTLL